MFSGHDLNKLSVTFCQIDSSKFLKLLTPLKIEHTITLVVYRS